MRRDTGTALHASHDLGDAAHETDEAENPGNLPKSATPLTTSSNGGNFKQIFLPCNRWLMTSFLYLRCPLETERIFSGTKLTIINKRSRLGPHVIEAIECVSCWMRVEPGTSVGALYRYLDGVQY